tara:strand:+ start:1764 stop:1973 length:210 start_codon:yes stop_codon:yes gene_type:complete
MQSRYGVQLPAMVGSLIVLFTQQYHLSLGRRLQQLTTGEWLPFLPPMPWAWTNRQSYIGQQASQRKSRE